MSSGIKVGKDIPELVERMKVHHLGDDPDARIRLISLTICKECEEDKHQVITVEKVYTQAELNSKENTFQFIQELMMEGKCRYLAYDCHFETDDGPKEDLVFIMWSPECEKVKNKMIYSSSKNVLKSVLAAKHEFELHDWDDIIPENFAERLRKMAKHKMLKLEGKELHCS